MADVEVKMSPELMPINTIPGFIQAVKRHFELLLKNSLGIPASQRDKWQAFVTAAAEVELRWEDFGNSFQTVSLSNIKAQSDRHVLMSAITEAADVLSNAVAEVNGDEPAKEDLTTESTGPTEKQTEALAAVVPTEEGLATEGTEDTENAKEKNHGTDV